MSTVTAKISNLKIKVKKQNSGKNQGPQNFENLKATIKHYILFPLTTLKSECFQSVYYNTKVK